jgi:hypothetical protein
VVRLLVRNLIKQTAFGIHLPVMSFDSNSDNRNIRKIKEKPHSREQLLSIARLNLLDMIH